jgi:hypothetical protein
VNPFEFVIVIILAGMGYSMWRMKHLAKLGVYEDRKGKIQELSSEREAELEREVEELRERVKVLERITVDDRDTHRLSDEIEKLRGE